jgi:8-oxo-dGTP diphosphatase
VKIVDVAAAVIERPGANGDIEFLLGQRASGSFYEGFWEFPGGKVEPGESAETALHRELHEELGCTVEILRALPRCTHAYEKITIEMIPFVARLAPGSPEPYLHEHVAFQWIVPSALASLDLPAADAPIIAAYLALRSKVRVKG